MTVTLDLFAAFVHLYDDGRIEPAERTFGSGEPGWHVMTFHAESDAEVHADYWEIHTEADELVVCVAGEIRLYLRADEDGPGVTLTTGHAMVVPSGTWHRIALTRPSDIMSITFPRGSRLEQRG
ncbi:MULTISPECIES: cupin domain-containing protein [unclassified Mycobacterium]|uniref:cupin domain-containing protein n=1 Tax=unclassified Mycobacterium TaxID=2642494 RepID=UPI0004903CC2|nr:MULTISPECIES: cupin domain-containing protein [unclassified Mycobacterium]SEB07283.1 Cupin domain-containing protein [Mycobacterium sp. 283mftsu]